MLMPGRQMLSLTFRTRAEMTLGVRINVTIAQGQLEN